MGQPIPVVIDHINGRAHYNDHINGRAHYNDHINLQIVW